MDSPLMDVLSGRIPLRRPVWLMRQAGRYLPEYRTLRSQTDNFLSFCLTPSLATEATLQPLRRFDLDAAILFADILLVPFALGQPVSFMEGEGPRLLRLETLKDVDRLSYNPEKVAAVFETTRQSREKIDTKQTLIGFSGAPWTVACYMIDGKGGKFEISQSWVREAEKLEFLVAKLIEATIFYLCSQIDAGAQIIQLFDSHAGLLKGEKFRKFVIKPTQIIVTRIKEKYPDMKMIGFPRGAAESDLISYAKETGVDALSLDEKASIRTMRNALGGRICLQGNLSPSVLLGGGTQMKEEVKTICLEAGPRHIFNLGHGIIKETPPDHVNQLIKIIREMDQGL